jgi:xylulokinase
VPTDNRTISQQIRAAEFPLVPHPGAAGFALLAQSPNGASVMQWLSELVGHDLSALLAAVNATSGGPAPVLAIPHLSGSINPQHGGRNSRAAFLGMTLATTPAVLLQALLESVAYDLALVLRQFSASGFAHHVLRATGGGARADWWMQLKADLTGLPVEVVQCREPGTFGAAILAGVAAGIYPSPGQAAEAMVHIGQRFAPNAHRCRLHREQLAAYRDVVAALMPTNRRLSHAAL